MIPSVPHGSDLLAEGDAGTMTYDDGTIAKVGDVVAVASGEGPERYIIIRPDLRQLAKLAPYRNRPEGRLTAVLPDHHFAHRIHSFWPLSDGAPRVCRYAEISVRECSEVW